MDVLINILALANILMAITLFVVNMAQMDHRYSQKVRAEYKRKSLLRGERDD